MNLQSCDNCGVVLDVDKIAFPDQKNWLKEDGTIDESMATRTGISWRAFVPCPACGSKFLEEYWL